MPAEQDGNDVTKIHTFKGDVEHVRSEIAVHPKGRGKAKEKPPARAVEYTPSAVVDAARVEGTRDAQAYLKTTPPAEVTQEPTAVERVRTAEHTEVHKQHEAAQTATTVETTHAAHKASAQTASPKSIETLNTPGVLSAEIATLTKETKKPSILSDAESVYDASEFGSIETGTIIKDKKRQRVGFTGALSALVTNWFHSLLQRDTAPATPPQPKTEAAAKRAADASVPEATKTISAPKDDFVEVVRERVRASKAGVPQAEKAAAQHRQPPAEASGWTHLIEDAQQAKRIEMDLDTAIATQLQPPSPASVTPETTALSGGPMWQAPKASSVRVAVSKPVSAALPNASPAAQMPATHNAPEKLLAADVFDIVQPSKFAAPQPETEMPTAPPLPIPEETPIIPEPLTAEPPKPVLEPEPEKPEPESAPKAKTPSDNDAAAALKPAIDTPTLPEPPASAAADAPAPMAGPRSPSGFKRLEIREGLRAAKNAPTNSLAVGIMIMLATMTLGVFASMKLFTETTVPNSAINIAQPPAVIVVQKQLPLPITNDRTELLTGVRSILGAEPDTIQVYPTALGSSGRDEPASSATILQTLDLRIDGSFERAITEIALGGTGIAEPFLILKVTDFDTAFAGLLRWEASMSSDLAPLFGEPVTETLDPQARTANGTSRAFFVDAIVANRSSRILYDGLGLERLVYVFVDQQTILITTNRAAVDRLVPHIR